MKYECLVSPFFSILDFSPLLFPLISSVPGQLAGSVVGGGETQRQVVKVFLPIAPQADTSDVHRNCSQTHCYVA